MKLVIDNNNLADEFFEDTRLIGLVSPLKDYQVCRQLNTLLQFDFRINHDIEIQLFKKKRNYYFSVFEFAEPHCSLVHYLYNNHFDGEYLLPELKHIDYLWLIKGDGVGESYLAQLMDTAKYINGVQLAMELTNEKIKNKGHLIF